MSSKRKMFVVLNVNHEVPEVPDCAGLFGDRERAILERNYLELRNPENTYVVLDVGWQRDVDVIIPRKSWTLPHLDLTNAPLDTKVDLANDLADNNPIYEELAAERAQEKRGRQENESRKRAFLDAIAEIRQRLRPDAEAKFERENTALQEALARQRQAHADTLQARKKRRTERDTAAETQANDAQERERAVNKEVGRLKQSLSRIVTRYASDFESLMNKGTYGTVFATPKGISWKHGDHDPFALTVTTSLMSLKNVDA